MGSLLSGGGRGAPRTHTLYRIDLTELRRHDLLRTGYRGSLRWSRNGHETGSVKLAVEPCGIRLTYRNKQGDSDWIRIEEFIWFEYTDAGFGGRRPWFQCPGCQRRARILYGGRYFRCRRCTGATYESQYDGNFASVHSRIARLKARLGGDADDMTWGAIPDRPKGMHRKTYARIVSEIIEEWEKMDRRMLAYAERKGLLRRDRVS